MKRFENAQVGDEVYCMKKGDGIIIKIEKEKSICPNLVVQFKSFYDVKSYNCEGRHYIQDAEPILFYRKGSEKYLTERPEPEIDWSMVPEGTIVIPWDDKEPRTNNNECYQEVFMAYLPYLELPFWVFNDDSKCSATGYKYCKLAKPCKPEWIK